jgi:hypothetical protein
VGFSFYANDDEFETRNQNEGKMREDRTDRACQEGIYEKKQDAHAV